MGEEDIAHNFSKSQPVCNSLSSEVEDGQGKRFRKVETGKKGGGSFPLLASGR